MPLASASRFTCSEPGTAIARTPGATFRPRTISAATARSSRRLFVQEPMKTCCTDTSFSAVPGSSPM
jgi:hypothetical protein